MEMIMNPWQWYVAGPLIGLSVSVMLFFSNKLLGISSAFRHICALTLPKKKIEFLNYNVRNEIWNLVFVVGLLFGGLLGSNYLTYHEVNLLPSHFYTIQGKIQLFLGGILVGFGTRYAGGCTSGHAIAGLSTFQKSSLYAVISFFAGGVITVYLINLIKG